MVRDLFAQDHLLLARDLPPKCCGLDEICTRVIFKNPRNYTCACYHKIEDSSAVGSDMDSRPFYGPTNDVSTCSDFQKPYYNVGKSAKSTWTTTFVSCDLLDSRCDELVQLMGQA